mmetsp:Transcript_8930/g.18046  ORF Transcript_8930/g.18046 Transcript_8930/m.18046 type:complete len:205 (+) Transcript_8930:2236-2850(+)
MLHPVSIIISDLGKDLRNLEVIVLTLGELRASEVGAGNSLDVYGGAKSSRVLLHVKSLVNPAKCKPLPREALDFHCVGLSYEFVCYHPYVLSSRAPVYETEKLGDDLGRHILFVLVLLLALLIDLLASDKDTTASLKDANSIIVTLLALFVDNLACLVPSVGSLEESSPLLHSFVRNSLPLLHHRLLPKLPPLDRLDLSGGVRQ